MPDLVAFKTVEKLNPEAAERGRKPRQRLRVGLGGEMPGGALVVRRIIFSLEEEEVREVLGRDLTAFPITPVKVKLNLEILEG